MRFIALIGLIALSCVLSSFAQITVVQTAQSTGDRLTTKNPINFQPDFKFDGPTLKVDANVHFQKIMGFGGAFTEAAALNFYSMSLAKQQQLLDAYWGPNGIGYSVGRVHINSCDFSVSSYSYDDVEGDWDLTHFNITHDLKQMIPLMRSAMALSRNQIRIFGTPWSAPAWMKANGAMDHGPLPGLIQDEKVFRTWALFLSKFVTEYEKAGIPIWGMTVQNEPEFDAPWEACMYTPESERDFIKNYLGPQMRKDHPNLNIMIFDHNKDDVVVWADTILSDPEAAQYLWGTAVHWYSGDEFEHVATVHEHFPQKNILPSEACYCPFQLGVWSRGEGYAHDIIGDLNNWAVGWMDWNLFLNMQGGPNHLGNYCDSPIHVDAATQEIYFQPQYYYMGQISKFVAPDSIRVNSSFVNVSDDQLALIDCSAFLRPDGDVVVVVSNKQDLDFSFKLEYLGAMGVPVSAVVKIPAHGIATLQFRKSVV